MRLSARLAATLLLTGALPVAALDVVILEPAAGVPAFGEVAFEVEVLSEAAVRRVELRVDGRSVALLVEPPYRVTVDVGEDNAAHVFEVRVEDAAGERARRVLETPAIRIDDRVELPLRQLYVTISQGGRRVLGLPRRAFTVRDDGGEQELVTFEGGDVPFTALLLVDASDSMRGRRLEMALAGARAFVTSMQPLDRAALLLFSDRVLHATPFTGFAEVLEVGLAGVSAGGGTALADHLFVALEQLDARQGRRVLVILSDGIDVASALAMEQVLGVARRCAAMVYWIRPGGASQTEYTSAWRDRVGHRQEIETFERLVVESGGRVVPLADLAAAAQAFTEVLREIRDQYVLGYYPSGRHGPGTQHRVSVRVEGRGLAVRAREGYIEE